VGSNSPSLASCSECGKLLLVALGKSQVPKHRRADYPWMPCIGVAGEPLGWPPAGEEFLSDAPGCSSEPRTAALRLTPTRSP
jgi:hypothetical protein